MAVEGLLRSRHDGWICVLECAGLLGHEVELWRIDGRGALCWVLGVNQLPGGGAGW